METAGYIAITVIVLGVVFFVMFKKEIAAAIPRVRSIGKTGVVLDTAQREGGTEKDPRAEAEALLQELDNALVREAENTIREEFRKRSLTGEEASRVLSRYLAAVGIAFTFEVIYRNIFGSQISLLLYLNTQPLGQPTAALRPFYTSAAAQYPAAYQGFSFEQWIAFLRGQLLIRDEIEQIFITMRGREFLAYLTRQGISPNKLG